jgi:hypothetical protein
MRGGEKRKRKKTGGEEKGRQGEKAEAARSFLPISHG